MYWYRLVCTSYTTARARGGWCEVLQAGKRQYHGAKLDTEDSDTEDSDMSTSSRPTVN
jgi:hypothetical protein